MGGTVCQVYTRGALWKTKTRFLLNSTISFITLPPGCKCCAFNSITMRVHVMRYESDESQELETEYCGLVNEKPEFSHSVSYLFTFSLFKEVKKCGPGNLVISQTSQKFILRQNLVVTVDI